MPRAIEFFFDYGSPYSYLANAVLPDLARRHAVELVYRPMLLGGVFKATGNQSPAMEPVAAKRAYGGLALRRTAAQCGVPVPQNPHFPINTLALMRIAVAAQQTGVFAPFHAAVYPAFWLKGEDLGKAEVIAEVIAGVGLDAADLARRADTRPVKDELRATTEEAIARGAFGAPSLFFGGELYFGVDHLPFLERALAQSPGVKTAIGVGGPASGRADEFAKLAAFAVEAEKLGVDSAWSAEAWGYDAVSILAYLAAKTERLGLGSGILQISARAPSMTAMTAMALAALSGNRFILGLGASGPQVVEGLHGVAFAKPLARMRETVEIVRLAFRGEPLRYAGEHHVLPRPGGEGKALRLAQPGNPNIPIYLATLSPRALELTGELADGWLGTSFTPEAAEAHLAHLRRGAERAGRTLADLTLCVGCAFAETDDPEPLLAAQKPRMAFTLGAMGSAKTNFYNDAYRRGGFADAAIEVQRLWIAGKREEAARRVPDEMILRTTLIGPESRIRERLRAYRSAGIGVLRIEPLGRDDAARLDALGRAVELVRSETAVADRPA